ncbi:MAG: hypothetical protein GX811_04015 [Lentisphaerae bacterium]|nr:hypothetical protein [Lentisphaerota bacterium]
MGLYDRDYMRADRDTDEYEQRNKPGKGLIVIIISAILIVAFVLAIVLAGN